LQALIAAYQTGNNPTAALAEIVTLTQKRAQTLIRFNGTTCYCAEAELLSDINFKLLHTVAKYNYSEIR
jgi:hypothetical protein